MLRRTVRLLVLTVCLASIGAAVALAAVKVKPGAYADPKAQVFLNTDSKGKKVADFTQQCTRSSAIVIGDAEPKISSTGRFSYSGRANKISLGTLAGHVTITLSGTFSGKQVKGTIRSSGKLSAGCKKTSFTAKKSNGGG
jgi:hypothetical protein